VKGSPWLILCSGATGTAPRGAHSLALECRAGAKFPRNVRLDLPNFVRDVYYLPDRYWDLLEIAAYVFAADRLASRGRRDAVEFESWARDLRFVFRVRDPAFWRSTQVRAVNRPGFSGGCVT